MAAYGEELKTSSLRLIAQPKLHRRTCCFANQVIYSVYKVYRICDLGARLRGLGVQ